MRYTTVATTYWTLAAGAVLLLAATGTDLALANRLPVPTAALAGLLPLPVFLVLAAALAAVLAGTAGRFGLEAHAPDGGTRFDTGRAIRADRVIDGERATDGTRDADGTPATDGTRATDETRASASPLVAGALAAAALVLLTLTAGLLTVVGYLPLALVMAPFHEGMRESLAGAVDTSLVAQLVVVAGVLLWGAAAREHLRRRPLPLPAWARPEAAARWGRWATAVAVIAPVVYAATRFAWLVYPLGFDRDYWETARAEGSLLAGVWLGAFAVIGAVLTMGLVQRWGETVPAWVPGLGGRRVPVAAAVVPATFVAIVILPAGISMVRQVFAGDTATEIAENWAAYGPTLLWPLWGVALGAATLAYALRRRGEHRIEAGNAVARV